MLKNLLLVVSILLFSSYSYAQDLVQVCVPLEHRVFNQTGRQCAWSSLECLARQHRIKKAYHLTQVYKGEAIHPMVTSVLDGLQVKYYVCQPNNGVKNRRFLQRACSNGWGASVDISSIHMLVVVHFKDGLVGIIDNADPTLQVQLWPEEKFMQVWTGWAYTLEPPSFRK